MIPRHRPPFGVGELFAALTTHRQEISVEGLEAAYGAAFGLSHAILLPSARAGICWALRAAVDSHSEIAGPAYTCEAVHEAMARSGGRLRLMDTAVDSFLIDPASVTALHSENYALVLSEVYGHPYDSKFLSNTDRTPPRIKILDSAMTVPDSSIFQRLQNNDFGVVSFGLGKCMYSGWGAMGATKDYGLATEIRAQRESFLEKSTLLLLFKRAAQIFARTAAHSRLLYGACRIFRGSPQVHPEFPSSWCRDTSISAEWFLPSTAIDRRLNSRNLERRAWLSERRRLLAQRYQHNLAGVTAVIIPPSSSNAMSHYSIRVSAAHREAIRTALRKLGINTGTIFRIADYISASEFPNSTRISQEIINLPLDTDLTESEVDYVSNAVIQSVSQRDDATYCHLLP